jgi:predicted 2-oxoglutarate/Fe(II)-dependent dioxygenase YbiX
MMMIPVSKSLQMQSVRTNNPEPTYITSKNVISEEAAKTLMELVDERGKGSEWSYNPWCTEFQIANPFSSVRTENDEKIISVLPELFSVGESFLRHINWNFMNTICEIATGHHGFWILRYDENGFFEKHSDWDSGPNGIRPPIVATAAILLNDEFEGGNTVLFDSTDQETMIEQQEPLSALVWDGFTQHQVDKVTSGSRYALVIHYTGTIK